MNDFTVLQLKKAPHKPVVLKVVRKLDTGNDEEDVVIKVGLIIIIIGVDFIFGLNTGLISNYLGDFRVNLFLYNTLKCIC